MIILEVHMLYIHATGKLAKAMKVKLEAAPDEGDLDWLDVWYANVIDVGLPLPVLLFTNSVTRFSLVHPFDPRDEPEFLIHIFRHRLQMLSGVDLMQRHADFLLCKTNSRLVLGCMNELAMMIAHRVDRDLDSNRGVDLTEIEEWLNSGIIAGRRPASDFHDRLERSTPVLRPTHVPHLRVVD